VSDIEKAAKDAVEAARQGEQFAVMLAAIQAAQAQQQAPACHHQQPAPRQAGSVGKWIGLGVGGSALLLTVAVSAVAVAISAVALTICVLVLRSVYRDFQKGH
jgi:hypothetical protein